MSLRARMRFIQIVLLAAIISFSVNPAPAGAVAYPVIPVDTVAVVGNTDGDSVYVRADADPNAAILGETQRGDFVRIYGGPFTATDSSSWYQVDAEGIVGYVSADYLTPSLTVGGLADTATATDHVYVRSGSTQDDPILGQYHAGDDVLLYGDLEGSFYSVVYGDYIGWVHKDFIEIDGQASPAPTQPPVATETPTQIPDDPTAPQPTAAPTQVPTQAPTEPPVDIPSGSGSIIWPVRGGEWRFLQGYNGSSHYDSGLWQYQDSIDLVRSDGSTAGQPVYSPVNGTIRWFDPSTGGIAIDMGNGYAFAMFHAYYDSSLNVGDTITQGQYVGTIAPAYQAAAGSSPHLHITLWSTTDGGNWSRVSEPFVGQNAISGEEYYNSGVSFEHTGTIIYP